MLFISTIAAVVLVGCGGPKAPKGSVHIYAQEGDIVAVKQHLAAGTDVNAKDDYIGMTILQSAALGGQKEIVELLIAKGADVNAKGSKGYFTPLDTALSHSLDSVWRPQRYVCEVRQRQRQEGTAREVFEKVQC